MKKGADTICAIATAAGRGGLGIVRVSGPDVPRISRELTGSLPEARFATLSDFKDSGRGVIDTGIVLYFPAPNSFTGEHVLELQGHGGSFILQQVLQRVLELGARMARPGEFSERAFLQGVFSSRIQALQEELTSIRVFVEAAIDFPDEEIDFLAESDILDRVAKAVDHLDSLLAEARQGRLLRDGIVLAITGRPNAGKSSLLNALSGQESAIVTDIPGTTRDVLREQVDVDGIPVHVADTAGIRETSNVIEAEGVRRARQALESADIVLVVIDSTKSSGRDGSLVSEIPEGVKSITVFNKIDLATARPPAEVDEGSVWISAKTGQGMDELRDRIREAVGAADQLEGSFSARQRHIDALKRTAAHLKQGTAAMETQQAGELLAEELRLAQQALGEITGELLPDDLLGEIFSSFCIGK
jgi:tRNA modification GTPase